MGDHVERPFRILVAERDSMTADLLASALEREGGCQAGAVRSSELLSRLGTHPADLAVISADRDSHAGSGFELVHTVSSAYPKVLVVVILDQSTRGGVVEAFRCGARGVVSREQPISVFLSCIEHVRKGNIWAGGAEAEFLLDGIRSIPASNVMATDGANPLTDRELQVVQYAAMGKTNKVIASELHLSEHTVKNYLFRAFEKLGISSRVELLFYLTMRGHKFGPTKVVDIDVLPQEQRFGPERAGAAIGVDAGNLQKA